MLGEARPGQSSLSAGALRSRAWAQSWSSAALAARSVLPSNRPATPLFSPACWEPGFQAWAALSLFTFMHWRRKWQPTPAQAWKPSSQHAGEKSGVAGLLLGRTERAARAAELQLCAQAR